MLEVLGFIIVVETCERAEIRFVRLDTNERTTKSHKSINRMKKKRNKGKGTHSVVVELENDVSVSRHMEDVEGEHVKAAKDLPHLINPH